MTFNDIFHLNYDLTFHSCNPTSCGMLWLYLAVLHITLCQTIPCHMRFDEESATTSEAWFLLKKLAFLTNCYIFYHHTAIFIHHPYLQPAVLTHHQNVDHVISSLTSSSLSWLPGRASRSTHLERPTPVHHKAAKWHLLHSPAAPSSWDLHPLPSEKPGCCYRLRNPILLGQYC